MRLHIAHELAFASLLLARPSIRSASAAAGHRFTEVNGCPLEKIPDGSRAIMDGGATLPSFGGFC